MFTGIVEEVGTLAEVRAAPPGALLAVTCAQVTEDLGIGHSVAVDGVCLTVTAVTADGFTAAAMGETLVRTTLEDRRAGDPVNLERALLAGARLGGHLVQGHVDGVGAVTAVTPHDAWTTVAVAVPHSLARYLAEKGSVTLDGVALTLTAVHDDGFEVGLIPHTQTVTTLGSLAPGRRVNLEVDVIAKYVERLLAAGVSTPYTAPVRAAADWTSEDRSAPDSARGPQRGSQPVQEARSGAIDAAPVRAAADWTSEDRSAPDSARGPQRGSQPVQEARSGAIDAAPVRAAADWTSEDRSAPDSARGPQRGSQPVQEARSGAIDAAPVRAAADWTSEDRSAPDSARGPQRGSQPVQEARSGAIDREGRP